MYLLLSHFCPFLKVLRSNGFSDSDVLCDSGIELEMQWIIRTMLDREDFITHTIDANDWQISTCSVFRIPGLYLGATYSGLFLSFSITRKSTSCIQDFGNQDIAEWISSSRISEGKIALLFPR